MSAFRQLTLLCAGDQADLLEELLFLSEAAAVTLNDQGDDAIFEPPVGTHPVWPATEVTALYHDARSDQAILAQVAHLIQQSGMLLDVPNRLGVVEDQDWVRASLDQFQPFAIGPFWVCPSWHPLETPKQHIPLRLDPGLAFGTGMHPTTQLCLEWIGSQPLQGRSGLDFGCGSGILAIAMGCMGMAEVTALDIDPQALVATESNAALNGLQITTGLADATPTAPVDVVVANILAGPLIELAPTLTALVGPQGHLVLAGLLTEQAEAVMAAYPDIDFSPPVDRLGWTRLAGTRRLGS